MSKKTMDRSKGFGVSKQTDNDVIADSTDIFAMPLIDTSIRSGKTVKVRPTSENNDGPFVFHAKPQGWNEYIQLNTIKFVGKLKISHTDKSALPKADILAKIRACNMLPAALIKSIDVQVNQVRVNDSHNLSHYQTMYQTLFSYNRDSACTHLMPQLFLMDVATEFDSLTANANAKTRSTRIDDEFDFMIPLSNDFLQSDRLLYPTSELTITLTRALDSFVMIAAEDKYTITLSDPELHVRYVTVNSKLVEGHVEAIKKTPAIYPIIKTDMKSYSVSSGSSSASFTDMFHNYVPSNIIVGMVSSKAYYGDITKNPFNFQHFNLSEAFFKVKNVQVPTIPIQPDFTKGHFQKEYANLLANTGVTSNQDFGNLITPALYVGGCFFFALDLSGEQDNMLRQREASSGTVDLEIKFRQDLTENIHVIVYSSSNAIVQIFDDKKVMVVPQPTTL